MTQDKVSDKLIKQMEEDHKEFEEIENNFIFAFLFDKEKKSFDEKLSFLGGEKRQSLINACYMLDFAKRVEDNKCEGVKFVLAFTAVESVMGDSNYETFQSWIKNIKNENDLVRGKDFEKSINDLVEKYYEQFGVIRHIKRFFREYSSDEDKRLIVSSIYIIKKEGGKRKHIPYCYISEDKCFDDNHYICIRERNSDCKLNTDEINKFLDKSIELLYDVFRNKFIHSGARDYFICKDPNTEVHYFEYKKNGKQKEFKIKETHKFNFDKFYEIILNGIKRWFEGQQKEVSE